MFECDKCGCCCRNIYKSDIYAQLDRGDGVCKYLSGNLCSIYDERPLICRIDESYDMFFANKMEREEFYLLNKQMCKKLKAEEE